MGPMMMALAGTAGKALVQEGAKAAGTYIAGKTAEQVGSKNEGASNGFRASNDPRNAFAAFQQNAANQDTTNNAGNQGQRLSREDAVFDNQLGQSNNRAEAAIKMAIYDQDNAFQNGRQLANNYTDTANRQAATIANLAASILGNKMNLSR